MRLKLNLILEEDSQRILVINDSKFKKIVFPVNTHASNSIRDLKLSITKFLCNLFKSKLEVENLFLSEFLLLDEFETNMILNNDDEVR
jgi:hypothetical protein